MKCGPMPFLLAALVARAVGSECAADGTCGEPDATGLLQANTGNIQVQGLQELSRREMTKVAANYTCEEACGMLGGLCLSDPSSQPCARRRAEGDQTWACSCDISLGLLDAGPYKPDPSAKLSASHFLMTHDSATGYIGKKDIIFSKFAQAQFVNLKTQLDCGARAFDLRLAQHDGKIYFHHGETPVFNWLSQQTLPGELPGLVDWVGEHPDELVIIMVGHCADKGFINYDSKDCTDEEFVKPFTDAGVAFESDCAKLRNMTLAGAMAAGALSNGGHLMAIYDDCVESNWKSSVDSIEKVKPYVEKTMEKERGSGDLFMVQSFIQQKFLMKQSTELNKDIASWITGSNLYDGVNFLEINTICASGMAISRSLGATISQADADTCIRRCKTDCPACEV
ncbi:HERC1 [Symbiodinium natans]|uniref:HERC1 protein n=1 Tax=Symbiodinium natans TaxID=878477 RepID=A0A812P0Z4_9DINO|nr:HERC1 [Symbiodinium natans]